MPCEPSGKFYKDWDCAWYEVNEDGLITEVRAYLTNNFGRTHAIPGLTEDMQKYFRSPLVLKEQTRYESRH
jgi:hypothetical protein